ncbi:MAG: DUF1570 domain-containing protein [Planctomycetes bacterium]|nr:DUF1570 domain-containing protein [Planctomycetota bacterium]
MLHIEPMRQLSGKNKWLSFWMVLLFLLELTGFGGITVRADIVYLKNGRTLEGRIEQLHDQVKLSFRSGSIILNQSDILRIEEKALPEQIFAAKLRKIPRNADAYVDLAKWAYGKNLKEEYVMALRAALQMNRRHVTARQLLRDYEHRLAFLAYDDHAAQSMLDEMGSGFHLLRTQHFRIAYSCSYDYADLFGELLEEVYRKFIAFFQQRNFDPAPLTDRLEVILFDNRGAFRAYTQTLQPNLVQSSGFYLSETGRSYFYDSSGNEKHLVFLEEYHKARKALEDQKREVLANSNENSRFTLSGPEGSQRVITRDELLAQIEQHQVKNKEQFLRSKKNNRNMNISVTVHEAVHQLAYSCGIHSRYFTNPAWLVEGLALYFEAPDQGYWNGPGAIHPSRLKAHLENIRLRSGITLDDLIVTDDYFDVSGSRADQAYAAGWALFYYLANHHHEQLFDYVFDLSVRHSGGKYKAPQRRSDFQKYFGNPEILEATWMKSMRDLTKGQGND